MRYGKISACMAVFCCIAFVSPLGNLDFPNMATAPAGFPLQPVAGGGAPGILGNISADELMGMILNDALVPDDLRPGSDPGAPPPGPSVRVIGPGFYNQAEYMIGTATVNVLFPESNGVVDPSTEDWSDARRVECINGITAGLNWWAAKETMGRLQFTVHNLSDHSKELQDYEPTSRAHAGTNESLWVSQVMSNLGYSSGSSLQRVRNYNHDQRKAWGTDWGFTIFVADSKNGNGSFYDGAFAYAYLGGPYVVMTYKNDGYGIANMNAVVAHEVVHTFYGIDEYAASGELPTTRTGYLNFDNQNSQNGGSSNVACIMRGGIVPYTNNNVCHYTKGQLGWYDGDSDGIMDPVDTVPQTTLTAYTPDPTTDTTPTYTGSAQDVPLANNNPWPFYTKVDVSVNKIAMVQYRVDSGTWRNCTPTDGAFNQYMENYTFTTDSLNAGTYAIETRAQNSAGNWDQTPASDSLTITASPPGTPAPDDSVSGWTNDDTPAFSWSVPSSGPGIKGYWHNCDNGTDTWTTSTSVTLSAQPNGAHTFYVKAEDNDGNTGNYGSHQYKIDKTAPGAPSPNDGAAGWSNDDTPAFSWSAVSDTSGVAGYYWNCDNGTDTWTTSTSVTLSAQPNGAHTFYVAEKDGAGNTGSYGSHQYKIDTGAPGAPTPDDGFSGWNKDNTPAFSWSAVADSSGVAGYYWNCDNGSSTWTTSTSVTLSTQADGAHTFYVQEKDGAGNTGSWGSHQYKVDATQPGAPTPNDGVTGWTNNNTPAFSWSAPTDTSGVAGYYWKIGAGGTEAWTDSTTVSLGAQTDGTKTFYVKAKDNAGNNGTYGTHAFSIDTAKPVTAMSASGGTVTLSGSDGGFSGVKYTKYRVDNGSWLTYSAPFLVPGAGLHALDWYSEDNAGNVEATRSTCIYNQGLAAGWNSFSTPLVSSGFNASDIAAQLANGDIVSKWDPATQAYSSYVKGGASPNFGMGSGTGYLVYCAAGITVTTLGADPSGGSRSYSFALPSGGGWILAGWTSLSAAANASDIAGYVSGASARFVSTGTAAGPRDDYVVGFSPMEYDFAISPGCSYWVWADGPCSIDYFS